MSIRTLRSNRGAALVGSYRLAKNRDLSPVIRVVLSDAVQHRRHAPVTLRSVAGQILVAQHGNDFPQPVVAVSHRSACLSPMFLGFPVGQRPILSLEGLGLTAGDATEGNVRPRGDVQHQLPDGMGGGYGPLKSLTRGQAAKQRVERGSVPRVTAERPADLVGNALALGLVTALFIYQMLALRL